MFSSRLPAALASNALAQAVARARAAGIPLLDLTETNPTRVGLSYPPDVLSSLADPRGAEYRPDPLGLVGARTAVAAYIAGSGVLVSPDRIVLSPSTSDAYAMLFKLLCDPGDAVLIPQPSYPLFDLLAGLEGIEARPYRLDPHAAWAIDRPTLEHALTDRARAVLVVSPNNPTGSMLRADDREWLVDLAVARGLALIVDEVFAEYLLVPKADARSMVGERRAVVFTLGGLSKSAGLPQIKLAWTIVDGPSSRVAEAIERLSIIADTYLSVSTPVQVAAATLIESGGQVRAQIRQRITTNLDTLRAWAKDHPAITLLPPEGGWSAVLQVPRTQSEESLVLRLIEDARVLVHPGYFFDFPREAFLVVSLLPQPDVLAEALGRLSVVAGARA